MVETVASYAIAIAVLLVLIGFLYVTIFRSAEWNRPQAARGIGIAMLGGVILGICGIAKDNGAGDWIIILQAMGGVLLGGGILFMFYGLAKP